jgi:hypothetical protein
MFLFRGVLMNYNKLLLVLIKVKRLLEENLLVVKIGKLDRLGC